MDTMGTALVLGATGGIGGATARALMLRGWRVRALARDAVAAAAAWPTDAPDGAAIDWIDGDAMHRDDVVAAADGVGAIVHGVNPPGYRNWETLVLPMIDNTIAAARATGGARIVLPGTLYNYDPAIASVVGVDTPQRPGTRKGAIRVALEERLRAAAADVPSLIVRAGDFYGPGARQNWFSQAMVRPGGPVRRILHPGPDAGHAWAYLPDLAATITRLLDADVALRAFEHVPFPGHFDPDGRAMVDAVRRVVGREVPVRRFPWWAMRALAPFGGFAREAAEIAPAWRHAQRLDGTRLAELVGELPDAPPHTPLDAAVRATLADLGCLDAGSPSPLSTPSTPSSVSPTTHRSKSS